MASSTSDGVSSASVAAGASIRALSERFPGRVQIHLHPASSLPSGLTNLEGSDARAESAGLAVALVWTVESLRLLRGAGLTGSFTGTLAQFPQQNLFLGLPVQLLAEEVVYLLRRGLAVVVDEAQSYRPSTGAERTEVEDRIQTDRKHQQLAAWHERQLLRAKHSKSTPAQDTPDDKDLTGLPWHYTIPTTSEGLGWWIPVTYTTLSEVQTVWPYPVTQTEVASVALFEHLKERGLWCMNGLRFGGAFAVYPGDPLRYHSHYTAQLVLASEPIALTSLVANGRLGTAVKKTHLLCCLTAFDPLIPTDKSRPSPLKAIADGTFDLAPTPDQDQKSSDGRRFATFDIFSLAWAGFGT